MRWSSSDHVTVLLPTSHSKLPMCATRCASARLAWLRASSLSAVSRCFRHVEGGADAADDPGTARPGAARWRPRTSDHGSDTGRLGLARERRQMMGDSQIRRNRVTRGRPGPSSPTTVLASSSGAFSTLPAMCVNRRSRSVAQIVPGACRKIIRGGGSLALIAVKARVVDGQRGAARELLGEPEIGLPVESFGPAPHERQHADASPVGDERQHDQGPGVERLDQAEMFLVACGGPHEVQRDLRHEQRLPRAQRLSLGLRRVHVDGSRSAELLDEALLAPRRGARPRARGRRPSTTSTRHQSASAGTTSAPSVASTCS